MNERVLIDDYYVVNIYDPEKKELLMVVENNKQAAQKLGITYRQVMSAYTPNKKGIYKRVYSPMLDKEVACRIKPKTPDMKFIRGVLKKKKTSTTD